MGNINSPPSLNYFPSDFKTIKIVDQKPYGQAQIFKNTRTGNHVAMISAEVNESDMRRILKFSSLSSQVIKLLDWVCDDKSIALCTEQKSGSLYYEFCPSNLEREIQSLKKKGKRFIEEEVWYVLNSIIQLSLDLKSKSLTHKDLRPCNVLVNEFNVVKFAPVGLFPSDINSYQRWLFLEEKTYLAPENIKKEIQTLDWVSNDVFAAGLCILDMMTMDASYSMYKDVKLIHVKISNRLDTLKQYYSQGLIGLVSRMLQPQNIRISLSKLNLELSPFQKQIMSLEKFIFVVTEKPLSKKAKTNYSDSPRSLKYNELHIKSREHLKNLMQSSIPPLITNIQSQQPQQTSQPQNLTQAYSRSPTQTHRFQSQHTHSFVNNIANQVYLKQNVTQLGTPRDSQQNTPSYLTTNRQNVHPHQVKKISTLDPSISNYYQGSSQLHLSQSQNFLTPLVKNKFNGSPFNTSSNNNNSAQRTMIPGDNSFRENYMRLSPFKSKLQ